MFDVRINSDGINTNIYLKQIIFYYVLYTQMKFIEDININKLL